MSLLKGLFSHKLNAQKLIGNVISSSVIASKSIRVRPYCAEADLEEGEENTEATQPKGRPEHDVETSIKYLNSEAYKTTYRDAKVWEPYRRNHKGAFAPSKTRKTCVRKGVMATGNPCPICRDEYLVLHPKNVKLLDQFISPFTGEVLSYTKTGVCQKQHKNLLVAVEQAWDLGYIKMPLPTRLYDYSLYKDSSK
ncbi:DgyrCDS11388 [Dimorphilus gyrociliatus]|uniref:Small ribosomal subunit protein mS40 n=1 Tax=Dimorphilus gyrociliatus TaxID=2664684 RepID=A0A7I8W476_9ANNE|nr:DgyrCDS11388 [Dimorphilus gyrociliatus]